MWRVEAAELVARGVSLTTLDRVGPWIAGEIARLADSAGDVRPPPLRDGFLTWTLASDAAQHWPGRVRGDLQTHTVWTDGHSTVEEMATAAAAAGYEHLLITDHTKGLPIANGLSEERLREQWTEFDRVANAVPIRLLRGVEMNIDSVGDGDMDASVLRELDVILGAFHSALRRKEDQTERYLAALRNPWLDILGHPRCRMFNFRIGLSADWPRVFAEAAKLDKAIEVDGYPDRQDVDVQLLRVAAESGVRISLGSDAHHVVDLEFMMFAKGAVALVGIPPERVINNMPADELVAWAGSHRRTSNGAGLT